MDLVKKVQEYTVNGKMIIDILPEKYLKCGHTWMTSGDTVLFQSDGWPIVETKTLEVGSPILYKWKVTGDKVTAINYAAVRLTPSLSEVHFTHI